MMKQSRFYRDASPIISDLIARRKGGAHETYPTVAIAAYVWQHSRPITVASLCKQTGFSREVVLQAINQLKTYGLINVCMCGNIVAPRVPKSCLDCKHREAYAEAQTAAAPVLKPV